MNSWRAQLGLFNSPPHQTASCRHSTHYTIPSPFFSFCSLGKRCPVYNQQVLCTSEQYRQPGYTTQSTMPPRVRKTLPYKVEEEIIADIEKGRRKADLASQHQDNESPIRTVWKNHDRIKAILHGSPGEGLAAKQVLVTWLWKKTRNLWLDTYRGRLGLMSLLMANRFVSRPTFIIKK